MKFLPQSQPPRRATRAHFADPAPAVLRLKDGRRLPAGLKTVSVTGGLLAVRHPLDAGSSGRLMVLTEAGAVLASAEMLSPITWNLQPFRFLVLDIKDEARIQSIVQSYVEGLRGGQSQIERLRAW
jgi:hypothetical protein